jgi:hypothetical protein
VAFAGPSPSRFRRVQFNKEARKPHALKEEPCALKHIEEVIRAERILADFARNFKWFGALSESATIDPSSHLPKPFE